MQRTRGQLLGTGARGLNNPSTGIVPGKLVRSEEINLILTDIIDSMFVLETDDTDNVDSGTINSLLTDQAQTLIGVKTFNNTPVMQSGVKLKQAINDTNSTTILGNTNLGTSYTLILPDNLPLLGEGLAITEVNGSIFTLDWTPQLTSQVQSGQVNRLAIYEGGTSVSDSGSNTSLGTIVNLPNETGKVFNIPSIGVEASADFILNVSDQSVSGAKTFSDITASNGIKVGSVNKVTLGAAPDSDYSINLPTTAPTASTQLVSAKDNQLSYLGILSPSGNTSNGLEITDTGVRLNFADNTNPGIVSIGSQVFAGQKIFNGGLVSANENPVKLTNNTSGVLNLNISSTQLIEWTLTFPDTIGSTGQLLTLDGSGQLQWSDLPDNGISDGALGVVPIYTGTDSIGTSPTLGAGTASIQISPVSTSSVFTIPDVGGSSDFMMLLGSQTVTGNKTFNGSSVFSGNVEITGGGIDLSQDTVINATSAGGLTIGASNLEKLGFYGQTTVIQPTNITVASTTGLTTADSLASANFSLSASTNTSAWGFANQDDLLGIISTAINTQSRLNELITKLQSLGLIGS